MKSTNNVLLVRVPVQESTAGRALRDYILESLPLGVPVLTEDATCEVMELPPLGDDNVEVEAICQETENREVEPSLADVTGRNKEEKLAILERLRQYRRIHGLGCWNEVAKEAGANITPELIRGMVLGEESPPIADWRRIDRAIRRLDATVATAC